LLLATLLLLSSVVLSTLVDVGNITVFLFSGLLFLLDLTFNLLVDSAFAGSVEGVESVAGNQEGSRAQGEVLGAAHISDLLVVEISANSAGSVTEHVVSVDDDTLSVSGDLDATSNNLDSTIGHGHDLSNGHVVSMTGRLDDEWKSLLLSVDKDGHTGSSSLLLLAIASTEDSVLDVGKVSLLLLLLLLVSRGNNLDLGLTAQKDGDGSARVLIQVLDEDGHWVAS